MKTQDAISFFKTQVALANALGLSQPTISGWGETVPPLRQLQLELLTSGQLKADPDLLKPKPKAQAAA